MPVKRTRKTARLRKAATADVVGPGTTSERVPAKWRKHHARLMKIRDYLRARQTDLARDAADEQTTFSLHMADAGTDSFDRDLALSQISSEQDAVYEVEEALNRIRNGTYGICELTRKRIEPARLEAIPWTRFCLEAAKSLEQEGAVHKTRLAPREPVTRGTTEDVESGAGDESAGE